MKKILASACAAATLSLAAPASAQSGILGEVIESVLGGSSRIGNFDRRIQVAYQRGEISSSEARDLQQRYYRLRDLERRYRQDGLSRSERNDLQRRAGDLQRRLDRARYERGERDRDDDWDDDDRDWDDRDDDDHWSDRGRCPPGLAKKNNGCMPPGQVERDGYRDTRYSDDR